MYDAGSLATAYNSQRFMAYFLIEILCFARALRYIHVSCVPSRLWLERCCAASPRRVKRSPSVETTGFLETPSLVLSLWGLQGFEAPTPLSRRTKAKNLVSDPGFPSACVGRSGDVRLGGSSKHPFATAPPPRQTKTTIA